MNTIKNRNCPYCGDITSTTKLNNNEFFIFPIYDVAFFNFAIDFSPYLDSKNEYFSYKICSCGHLINYESTSCPNCGKGKNEPIRYCNCGAKIDNNSNYCENCGAIIDNYSEDANFNLKSKFSIICNCGHENVPDSLFCENCGLPIQKYNETFSDYLKICVCSEINPFSSDYCFNCGRQIKDEIVALSCVCGAINPIGTEYCSNCSRPLNPKRVIKSKLLCKCGNILDYNDEYCSSCGRDIKKIRKHSLLRKYLRIKMLYCDIRGCEISKYDNYCIHCGNYISI